MIRTPSRTSSALRLLTGALLAVLLSIRAVQAAPAQDLSPADYTGYVLKSSYAYGEVMATGGDWLAVGTSSSYKGSVLLWKRQTSAGTDSTTWVMKQELVWPDTGDSAGDEFFGRKLAMVPPAHACWSAVTIDTSACTSLCVREMPGPWRAGCSRWPGMRPITPLPKNW